MGPASERIHRRADPPRHGGRAAVGRHRVGARRALGHRPRVGRRSRRLGPIRAAAGRAARRVDVQAPPRLDRPDRRAAGRSGGNRSGRPATDRDRAMGLRDLGRGDLARRAAARGSGRASALQRVACRTARCCRGHSCRHVASLVRGSGRHAAPSRLPDRGRGRRHRCLTRERRTSTTSRWRSSSSSTGRRASDEGRRRCPMLTRCCGTP